MTTPAPTYRRRSLIPQCSETCPMYFGNSHASRRCEDSTIANYCKIALEAQLAERASMVDSINAVRDWVRVKDALSELGDDADAQVRASLEADLDACSLAVRFAPDGAEEARQ